MDELFIQYDLSSHESELFYVVNTGEVKDITIVVCDANYNIPVTLVNLVVHPGLRYWFSGRNVAEAIYNPKFRGFRYLIIDNETGSRSEILSGVKPKKEIEITLPDLYLLGDPYLSYFNCLYTDKVDYLFENMYDGWFLDLGANLGSYTALAIKKGIEKCLLVEPTPILADSLKLTFSNFKDIVVEEGAVTDRNADKISFKTYGSDSVCNLVSDEGQISVSNYRIAELIKKHNIDKISLLKIDIEGSEYEVVMGLEDWVFNRTSSISLETHLNQGGDDSHLVEKIMGKGFTYKRISKSETHGEHFFYKT